MPLNQASLTTFMSSVDGPEPLVRPPQCIGPVLPHQIACYQSSIVKQQAI
jgi:hypothetical protein